MQHHFLSRLVRQYLSCIACFLRAFRQVGARHLPERLECSINIHSSIRPVGTGLIEENSVLYKAGTGLKQDPFPIRPGALFKAGHFVCHRAALNRDLYCTCSTLPMGRRARKVFFPCPYGKYQPLDVEVIPRFLELRHEKLLVEAGGRRVRYLTT